MNNSDFARLLTSDDKALVKELTQHRANKKKREMPKGAKGKGKDKDGNKKGKGGAKGEETGSLLPKQPTYRDRATERREGKGEYETINAEWEGHEEVTVDQSKYLGGDLDHTHLVKGLDFALLSKVRTELTKQDKADELQTQRQQRKEKKQRTFTSALAKKVWHTVVETLHPHHGTFQQRLHGMCKAISKGQRIRNAPQVFLPGRMEYEFDVADKADNTDIPRIIYMSKEDAPKPDWSKKVSGVLPETVAKVSNCLLRAAEERKRRKLDRTTGATASYTVAQKIPAPKIKAKDAEEDIFGGVGGFNGAEAAAKEAARKKAAHQAARSKDAPADAKQKASYFDDAGHEKYRQTPEDRQQLSLDDVEVAEGGAASAKGDGEFEASSKWRGSRPGWVFKLDDAGLGYYLDDAKLAAKAAHAKAGAAALKATTQAPEGRKALRSAKTTKPQKNGDEVDDDAYGELFPSSMQGLATVMTGEDGSDEEDDGVKKKIERLKKLGEKDKAKDSVETSAYGKKGKDASDAKKRKITENQEWQKIDGMIKKGKISSIAELEARGSGGKRAPVPREVFSTPAFF